MIKDLLKGKIREERANLKGKEFAKIGAVPRLQLSRYYDGWIEILETNPIEKGVEVLVRAWDQFDGQIGFGDGTVEIERFKIINPPILVPDGTKITEVDELGQEYQRDNFKEDVYAALVDTLDHTLKVIPKHDSRNIVKGKTGGTVTTAYATAGGDGDLAVNLDTVWNTAHDRTSSDLVEKTQTSIRVRSEFDATNYVIYRGYCPTDITAVGGGQTVSAVTFSAYGLTVSDGGGSIGLTLATQASGTDLVAADFDNLTIDNPAEGASRIAISAWSTTGYNDFAGNATAISWAQNVTSSGFLDWCLRTNEDITDVQPAGTADDARLSSADEVGTTQDPKTVVTHALTSVIKSMPFLIY